MSPHQSNLQSKHWCFTLNNWAPEDAPTSEWSWHSPTTYVVFGREIAPSTGTPHLQGFVAFSSRQRLSAVSKNWNKRANWSVCRSIENAIEYCKKDGDFDEFGTTPCKAGSRTDLDAFKEAVRGGSLTLNQVREDFSHVYARHPRFCVEYMRQHAPKLVIPDHPLRRWQRTILEILKGPVHPRHITFVVDETGDAGKTWYTTYLSQNLPDVLVVLPARKSDQIYAVATCGFTPRTFIVDAPRSRQGELMHYDFLEEVKNGRIFSPKYESHLIEFPQPHVVVMMNQEPKRGPDILSEDRYDIVYADKDL